MLLSKLLMMMIMMNDQDDCYVEKEDEGDVFYGEDFTCVEMPHIPYTLLLEHMQSVVYIFP